MKNDNLYFLYNLANNNYKQKKYQEAVVLFQSILEINEYEKDALIGLIKSLLELNKAKEVQIKCNQYLERFGADACLYYFRGQAKAQLQQYEEAIIDYKLAIGLDSTNALIYNEIGCAYRTIEKYQIAKTYFDEAIKLDSEYSCAYNNRAANSYFCNESLDDILKDCYTAINIDSSNIFARNNLIEKLVLSKQYKEALEHAKYAEDISPQMAVLYGVVYYHTGQQDQAVRCFAENYNDIELICNIYKLYLKSINNVIKLNSENNYILPRVGELETLLKTINDIYELINSSQIEFCSFCKTPLLSYKKYIKHNDYILCDECLALSNELLQAEKCFSLDYMAQYPNPKLQNKTKFHCSFCGRNSLEVEKFIVAPNDIMICNGCVGVCNKVIENNSDFATEYPKAVNRTTLRMFEMIGENTELACKKRINTLTLIKTILIISLICIIGFVKFQKLKYIKFNSNNIPIIEYKLKDL